MDARTGMVRREVLLNNSHWRSGPPVVRRHGRPETARYVVQTSLFLGFDRIARPH